jgi:hypothetical protein
VHDLMFVGAPLLCTTKYSTMKGPMRNDPATTARLEIRALEKMVRALCRHTDLLSRAAEERGALDSREAEFQLEAFYERRAEAAQLLEPGAREPDALRIARLEKLVEALECSRTYFRSP